MKQYTFALAMAALLAASATGSAAPIIISGDMAQSTNGLGNFSATLTYSASDASNATLTLSLTNTTPSAGGYITAFVLNNPDDKIGGIVLVPGDPDFDLIDLDPDNVNGGPFGQFDFGATTGNGFEGGGNPNLGIAVGDSANFTFNLTGTDLDLLTEENFLGEESVGPGDGQGHKSLVVRFRGMDEEPGSDKVPGHENPEPSTLLLSLVGLGALLPAYRARRRLAL